MTTGAWAGVHTGFKALLVLICATLLCACHYLRSTEIPIPAEYFHHAEANSTLIVLLHGIGGKAENFVNYGTVDQILECNADVNVVGVDNHFGYYREEMIIERLQQDVVQPARNAGITEVWFVAVSLGGLASLEYRRRYPEEIDAVIAMAPYLGEWDQLQAYLADPQVFRESDNSIFPDFWDSLLNLHPQGADLTLAYGEDDDFEPQLRWFADRLDGQRVITAPGGHRWSVWKNLWPAALNRSGLCAPLAE